MMQPSLIERITRSLAYMLRHKPDEFGIELDPQGYAELDEVLRALEERLGESIEEEDVLDAVEGGDRERYEVRDGRIRAWYGHSIDVDPGPPGKPPEVLYLGVASPDAERALRFGLRGGRRRFLHLALTPEDALETGRRLARDYTVLEIQALDAWEEGVNFYDRRALYLADPIPTEFIAVFEERHDGETPAPRGPRRGEPERPQGRGGRDRGRDRDRDRDRDRGRDREPARRPEPAARSERAEPSARPERAEPSARPEPAARAERRPPPERSPAPGRGPSHESDRGPERPRTPDRVERREPAPGPRPEAKPAPQPTAPAPARNESGGFGLGIFEEPAPVRRPAPEPPASPPPPARSAPEPPPRPAGDSFGAGIL